MIDGVMFEMHYKFSPLASASPCQDAENDAFAGQKSRLLKLQPIFIWLFIQKEMELMERSNILSFTGKFSQKYLPLTSSKSLALVNQRWAPSALLLWSEGRCKVTSFSAHLNV